MRNKQVGTDFEVLDHCVACNLDQLELTLDLGNQTLANEYLDNDTEIEIFPLSLWKCSNCSHSQLGIAVNPERLFRNYSYVSNTSRTLSKYFDRFSDFIIQNHGPKGKILDIGSNDGSFLEKFSGTSWNGIGVDPAINLIQEAHSRGVKTLPTFFDQKTAELLASDFDVVVAMNVFAHTAQPVEILLAIEKCLSENGTVYIQTSQADMFTLGQFDTVYHEHISFFNVRSMRALLARTNLNLVDVSIVPIHGDSYLWKISRKKIEDIKVEREQFENNNGFYADDLYSNFSLNASRCAENVSRIVQEYKLQQFKIVSYGAAAKGNTFINFANLDFDYIVDDTNHKIGRMAPAGGCFVSSPEILETISEPCLTIIPAWNFAPEIKAKIKLRRKNDADVILVYFPEISLTKLADI